MGEREHGSCAGHQKQSDKNEKKKLDKRAVLRSLAVGDSVLLGTPGLDSKLVDSWEGPYFVKTKFGAVTYKLNVGKLKTRIAHINSLRKFEERREELKRIAMVLEGDTDSDCVMNTNSKLKLVGGSVRCDLLEDIDRWKEEFSETLTEEPGETELVEFSIETGDADPIA